MLIHVFLFVAALLTSGISGAIGMAGGISLFSLLTFFYELRLLIPIHGVAQFASNLSRSLFLYKNIDWRIFSYFIVGVPFGVALAYPVLKSFHHEQLFFLIIAGMIFVAILPQSKIQKAKSKLAKAWPDWVFFFTGIIAAFMGLLIGSLGPFLAVFFLKTRLKKEEIVATKAVSQMCVHFLKIPVYLSLGFEWELYLVPMGILVVGAILGSYFGVKVLRLLSRRVFDVLFKSMLLVAALRLLYKSFF